MGYELMSLEDAKATMMVRDLRALSRAVPGAVPGVPARIVWVASEPPEAESSSLGSPPC